MQLGQFLVVMFLVNLLLPSVQSERTVYKISENRPTVLLPECDYVRVHVKCQEVGYCKSDITLQLPGNDSYLNDPLRMVLRKSPNYMIEISEENLNFSYGLDVDTLEIDRELQTLKGRAMIVSTNCKMELELWITTSGCNTGVQTKEFDTTCLKAQTWKNATFGVGGAAIFLLLVTLFLVFHLLRMKRTIRSLKGQAIKTDTQLEMQNQNVRWPEPRWNSDQYSEEESDIYENPAYGLRSNQSMYESHLNTLNSSDRHEIRKNMREDLDIIYVNISDVIRSKDPVYVNQLNMKM